MHCTQCGNKLNSNDKYCASCGAEVSKPSPRNRNQRSNAERAPRPPFSNKEGVAQQEQLLALKKKQTTKRRLIVIPIIWGIALTIWLKNYYGHDGGVMLSSLLACMGGAAFVSIFGLAMTEKGGVTSDEYYRFVGSRNAAGDHQCIFCGGRGHYVKGQYATNWRHHNCPKCGKYHFSTLG